MDERQLLVKKIKSRTISLDSGFWTAPNWTKVEKMTITLLSNLFNVRVSLLSVLDSGPSFTSIAITGSGVMQFFHEVFD